MSSVSVLCEPTHGETQYSPGINGGRSTSTVNDCLPSRGCTNPSKIGSACISATPALSVMSNETKADLCIPWLSSTNSIRRDIRGCSPSTFTERYLYDSEPDACAEGRVQVLPCEADTVLS